MTWMPEKLHTGRAVALTATVAAFAVAAAIPGGAALANDSDKAAAADTQSSRQVVANASTASGTTKANVQSKNSRTAHVDRVEARIMDLHSKLKITPAQEEQWTALTRVMRENARTMDALRQSRLENAANMTALDDVKSYSEMAEAHAEGLKNFVPAFEALYDSMSDSQKKVADQTFRGGNTRMASRPTAKGS